MTLIRWRNALLAFAALVVVPRSLHAQPLQSHLAHVLVSTTEDIDDIAINPGDGHLLVLAHCTVSCGAVVEYLDHYTLDGSFVMRTPLTVSVNRVLPVGSTIFLALESDRVAGGLFRLWGTAPIPVPLPRPLAGPTLNVAWRVGPDDAIYLTQRTVQSQPTERIASVVIRVTQDGASSVFGIVPPDVDFSDFDMSATQYGVFVQAVRIYRMTRTGVSDVYTSLTLQWPMTAPIDGGDGLIYLADWFPDFGYFFVCMSPDGMNPRQLEGWVYREPRSLVRLNPGHIYGIATDDSFIQGYLVEIRNGEARVVYDFPPSVGAPIRLVAGPDGVLYGASKHALFRVYSAGDPWTDVLLYDRVGGDRLLATVMPEGSIASDTVTWAPGWQIFPADFNRDGQRDLLFYNPTSGLFVKGIGIGNGEFEFTVSYAWAPNWDIHVVDLNGDGQSDLFLYNPTTGRWFAAMTVGDGTGDFDYTRTGVWAREWTITPVDWDADGRTDLFAYNKTSGLWVKVTTLADGTFDFPAWGYWASGWNIYDADFDGDGRSELFLYANAGTPVAGRNFVVRTVGDTFEYTEGMRWGPNWTVTIADLDGDGRSDIFVYDPATGWWYEVFKDGAVDTYYSGVWATNWSTALLHGAGESGVVTPTDALMVYNAATGMYFKVIPHGRGAFDYLGGTWPSGMTMIPMR